MNRILWYIKQLFPLTYRTTAEEDGEKYFHVWKMWFAMFIIMILSAIADAKEKI
jgi:hypothetical protein